MRPWWWAPNRRGLMASGNDSGRFYGLTRVREALTSRETQVSIRVLQQLGVRKLIEMAARVGSMSTTCSPT